ncbi:hypothetical protein JXA40_12020 [bacterium]|nr:hypothetical protein [candidate division CSSED10-310 bacterium]
MSNRFFNLRDVNLFLISFTLLFLEVMCIRWLSTEIRIFAYFQNFVLIACFLGFGIGCSLPELKIPVWITIVLLALFAVFTGYIHLFETGSRILGMFHDYHIVQTSVEDIPALQAVKDFLIVGLLFLLLVYMFLAVGVRLGRCLKDHPRPLWAYSVNVAGSLAGIWAYTLISYRDTPPWLWFIISLALLLYFALEDRSHFALAIIGSSLALLFVWQTPLPGQRIWWSPYQKLTLTPMYLDLDDLGNILPSTGKTKQRVHYGYNLTANQTHIQFLENLDIYPRFYGRIHRYNLPFFLLENPERVLILGSGCGNDVAAALRMGVEHIDAVEIDPLIVEIGRTLHPNRPYAGDRRVRVFTDDARSYLKKTTDRYDLICFSLLDAHTLGSGYTNIRLDDYVYTVESFREARRLLKPGGLVTMRFWTEQPFTAKRLFQNMTGAFGREPYTFWLEGMYCIAGNKPLDLSDRMGSDRDLAKILSDRERALDFLNAAGKTSPSQDDWPYLYLRAHQIPVSYLLIILVLFLATYFVLKTTVPGKLKFNVHFFFLGAGFLLVEIQNISRISLLFGNTWIVNSVIFSIILILILCANAIVAGFRISGTTGAYPFLGALILLAYIFPLNSLLGLAPAVRGTLAGILLCLPLFAAGIIFAVSFSHSRNLNTAMGSNMLGTVLGGVASSLSFVIGIKALSLIGLVFYAVTFLTRRQLR